jgi:mannose-6-phosphate isomerase-like protein (cupin superfamily)
MDAFELAELLAERERSGQLYLEFLKVPTLRVGIYALAAGGTDPQQPHAEDEVYYVIEGRGVIRVGDEDRPVAPGSVVFVAAGVEHRFHDIAEDLTILVFFASGQSAEGRGQ